MIAFQTAKHSNKLLLTCVLLKLWSEQEVFCWCAWVSKEIVPLNSIPVVLQCLITSSVQLGVWQSLGHTTKKEQFKRRCDFHYFYIFSKPRRSFYAGHWSFYAGLWSSDMHWVQCTYVDTYPTKYHTSPLAVENVEWWMLYECTMNTYAPSTGPRNCEIWITLPTYIRTYVHMCHFVYSSFSFTGVISKVGSVQCKCTVLIAMAVTKDGPLCIRTYVRTHIQNPTSEASHVCAIRTYMWMQQSIQALLVYNLYVCMYVYLHT